MSRCWVVPSLLLCCWSCRACAESTYAGDRDVRFLNCAVPCEFECQHPSLPASRLLRHRAVQPKLRQRSHDGGFDLKPSGKKTYSEELWASLASAHEALSRRRQSQGRDPVQLRPLLRVLHWDCAENCRYECMIKNRELRRTNGEQQVHYLGKWPFTRVLGLQELLSSLGSLLNGLPHLLLLLRGGWRGGVWRLSLLVNINTWLQSAIFHARESPLTEALDYHCASMSLATSLGVALYAQGCPAALAAAVPGLAWASLVWYISFVKFDYGFFMQCSVGLGVCSTLCWTVWALRPSRGRKRPFAWKVLVSYWGVYLVLPLELLDFPPVLGLLDAHALWHLLTVPLQFLLCSFVQDCLRYDSAGQEKEA